MTTLFLLAVASGLFYLVRLAIREVLREDMPDAGAAAADRIDGATTADLAASPSSSIAVLSAVDDDQDGTHPVSR